MWRALILAFVLLAGCERRQHRMVRDVALPAGGADATSTFDDNSIVHNDALGSLETARAMALGTWLPLGTLLAFAALWTLAHRRRSRREQDALNNAPLRNGPAVIAGRVETDGGDAITVAITQRMRIVKMKNGTSQTFWDEKRREVQARPFQVVTDGGQRVTVRPDARVHLRDTVEAPKKSTDDTRMRYVRLRAGERVWVSGTLSGVTTQPSGGAYREAAQAPTMTRGLAAMIVSTEAPGSYHADRAGTHRAWFKGALVTAALLHGTLLADVTLMTLSGHTVMLDPHQLASWDVWVKPKNQRGHWVHHCAVLGSARAGEADEEREVGCGFYRCVESGQCRTVPTQRALLTGNLLRDTGRGPTAHVVQMILAGAVGWIALIAYLIAVRITRPWYAGGKVNDGPHA